MISIMKRKTKWRDDFSEKVREDVFIFIRDREVLNILKDVYLARMDYYTDINDEKTGKRRRELN